MWSDSLIRVTLLIAGATLSLAAGAADKAPATWKEPVSGMEFVALPKGCFQMGNARAVVFREAFAGLPLAAHDFPFDDELPQHEVCVDALWMGRYEVRSDEWQRVMGGAKPARPDAPVADITWEQAQAFAARLTERAGGKHRFRLPTEAEWEYACRAGTAEEIVPKLGDLADRAWYVVEPKGIPDETQPVGKLAPNAFGLHDMLGNVWEWVQDGYRADAYQHHDLFNPVTAASGHDRVIRGASFRSEPIHVRCARRGHYAAGDALRTIGLRLVRVP